MASTRPGPLPGGLQPEMLSGLDPHQVLAAHVLHQAVRDAWNATLPEAARAQAQAFLAGGGTLLVWCDVAGLEARRVVALAGRRT